MQKEDAYIIHKCLNGEPEAFGFLVDRYKESVYALAHSKLHDFQDAEDVTQEVFIKAYQRLNTLRQWDSFYAWLYAITSNICKNWLNKRSKRPDQELMEEKDPKILEDHSLDSYRESLAQESLLGMIEDALCSLPEIYRQVITLYYLGGMSNKEIAGFLGVAPTAIKERLSRARMQLKEEILAMMSATFEQQRLKAGFTFRIVEAVKKIKIHPVSTMKGLPWGLSLATGIIITIMSLNPSLISFTNIGAPIYSALPSEMKVLKVGEIPVDVTKTSNIPILSSQQGKGKGGEPNQPDIQNAFFMAPQGEGGTWAKKADMPTARVNLSTSVVDGIIYAIGGSLNDSSATSTVEAYDPKTDTWTKKADMPTPRRGLSTCVVDGIIYAIGGWSPPLSTVEAYDPKMDTWTKKADMPTPRGALSTSVVDGIIYAIGGNPGGTWLSTVEVYDPKTDTWMPKKADMPTPRYGHSACVVNGIIYTIAGTTNGPGFGNPATVVEVYNPKSDTWIKKEVDLPPNILNWTGVVINKTIYAITSDGFFIAYDLATDTWTELKQGRTPMPTLRSWFPTSVVDGKIYAIGGGLVAWNVALDEGVVEEYTPEGWPFSISPQSKLPTKWGKVKSY